MKNNLINTIFDEKIVVPITLYNYRKDFKVSLESYMFLMYLLKYKKRVLFDLSLFKNELQMSEKELMNLLEELIKNDLVEIKVEENANKIKEEYLSLEPFCNKVVSKIMDVKEEVSSNDLYQTIEKEFGRTLSPIETEIINSWLDKNYSLSLIKEALKEAVFNGALSLKYIDKILFDWSKKGIKDASGVNNLKRLKDKEEKPEIEDYDWL